MGTGTNFSKSVVETRARARDRRRAGRATTFALAIVAAASIGALAFGLTRLMSPAAFSSSDSGSTARHGPDPVDPLVRQRPGQPSTSSAGGSNRADVASERTSVPIGRPVPEVSPPTREARVDGASRSSGRESANPILEKLRARREADAARAGDRVRRGAVHRPAPRGSGAANAAAEPTSRSNDAHPSDADADPSRTDPDSAADRNDPRIAFQPGYAEVAGVPVQTPAYRAGIQRGDRILEYNGAPVDGRIALEDAWSRPGLPENVPVIVQDGRTGDIRHLELPPGDLGVVMPYPYEN